MKRKLIRTIKIYESPHIKDLASWTRDYNNTKTIIRVRPQLDDMERFISLCHEFIHEATDMVKPTIMESERTILDNEHKIVKVEGYLKKVFGYYFKKGGNNDKKNRKE